MTKGGDILELIDYEKRGQRQLTSSLKRIMLQKAGN